MSLPPPPSREKLPVANGWAEMPISWLKYFTELANQAGATAATTWASISKSGSSLADLETRNHSALQNIDTADHAHLYLSDRDNLVSGANTVLHYHDSDRLSDNFTGTEWVDLTDAGATILHKHDHGGMDGLGDDDHTQYVLVSNMEADRATIASNWDDLTDAGDSALHYHASDRNADNHASGTTNKVFTATEQTKLSGIETGAEVNNISDANATDLTDAGATTLHKHDHNGQDGLQGGAVNEYYHLTSAEYAVLGASSLSLAAARAVSTLRI